MKTYGYSDHKNDILKRLRRAEGQVGGIARMVEQDSYCIDILTQLSATHAALDKVAVELIRDHAESCMTSSGKPEDVKQRAHELAQAIDRLL